MPSAKTIAAAILWALLIQYPVAFVFIAVPAVMGGASVPELVEFLAFYWFWVTIVATPVIVIAGLPAFLLIRARHSPSVGGMAVLGGIIAAGLAAIVLWTLSPGSGFSSGENYYGTYRDMVIDGVPTLWGWISFVEDTLMFAVHGALGAVFFLLGWRRYEAREDV